MSTKLFNGFKIEGDLIFAHKMFQKMREDLSAMVKEEYAKLYAENLETKWDRWGVGLDSEKPENVGFKYWCELMERHKEIKAIDKRDPEVDFEFELTLFPLKDKILGLYFCEQQKFVDYLFTKDYIEPYGYWNNTDPDEDVSEEEWERRGDEWEEALPGIGIPALNGYTVTLVQNNAEYVSKDEIRPHLRSTGDRVFAMAKDLVLRDLINFHQPKDYSDIMKLFRLSKNYILTRHGRQVLEHYTHFAWKRLLSPEELLERL